MPNRWQLQDAKNKLSHVINLAATHGPQTITRRGVKTAVILSAQDYDKLQQAHARTPLSAFFKASPLASLPHPLNLTRSKDLPRSPRQGFKT